MEKNKTQIPEEMANEQPVAEEAAQPKEGILAKAKKAHRNFVVWTRTTRSGRVLITIKRIGEAALAAYGLKRLIDDKRHKDEVVVITEGNLDVPEEEPAEDLPVDAGDEVNE